MPSALAGMSRFFRHLRIAFWRAFQHDAFAVAKGAAFSGILTFFPAILVPASILSRSQGSEVFVREIFRAVGRILPEGTNTTVAQYLTGTRPVKTGFLVWTSVLTLWTASGVMISWMEGFRHAYQMPKVWGLVKERLIAFLMVVLAGVPMGFASFLVVSGNLYRAVDDVPCRSRADALYSRAVDSGALDHCGSHKHCCHRTGLSSWRPSNSAVAPGFARSRSGNDAMGVRDGGVRVLFTALRELRRDLRIGRDRHCSTDLALPGVDGGNRRG